MIKTVFRIAKMDCPSEEQMVRMKVKGFEHIESLRFDIPSRTLEIYHTGSYTPLMTALHDLQLDTTLVSSGITDESADTEDENRQRRVLWQVLIINLSFFLIESLFGLMAGSMGLIADSLDMLADSIVYGLSLIAVAGTTRRKKTIAGVAGYFQAALAVFGLVEVIRRFASTPETPDFHLMISISFLACAGNALCLYLLQRSKSKEAHMQASMIFTSMDVIANLGVIAAGILVYVSGSRIPDLTIAAIVFVFVTRGAYRILQLAK
ncbi:MAG TPA: cation transporter [Syntrophorhabdaceae bacterium]|nr:cation transporter [Syntrophorhabdaceae bacterium]